MMTFSQPSTYDRYSSALGKRVSNKLSQLSAERRYHGSPSGSHGSFSMTSSTANPRTLPPYISVHRVSEPASPATIATTISSHSTPSPSPSNVRNNPSDFTLFDDDTIMAVAQDFNSNVGKGQTVLDSTVAENASGLNSYGPSGFPVIVPYDASYSNYGQSGICGSYSSVYPAPDATTTNLYGLGQDQPQQHQQQQQQTRYLRPASYRYPDNGNSHRSTGANSTSHDVEPIENVPALSPTSRQRNDASLTNVRPMSPRSPTGDQSGRVPNYATASSNYLQSAMPKLGRTFSDAAQGELYNPDLIHHTDRKPSQGALKRKQSVYQNSEVKCETGRSFPHIFREAQQQHQQDHTNSPQSRDRSPFRENSPYHPTNTVSYGIIGYDNSDHALQQTQLPHNIVMTMALREQGAEQKVAPKTISPRDSLLEYREPENQQSQMTLFPPLQNNRMVIEDADSSPHGSSQGGPDMDDFHSMATSRRESMANSSVSSHLDVPRFGYMQQQQQQASYDSVSPTTYYNPIQRPLDTSANTGTYTCTYSGCGQRFTSSTKLQKHRREAHRKSAPSGNSVSTAAAIASRNAQPGPHRCMRVNPSTGKPCNTVFSRPYDLTRHEDTIHNSAKQKVRCEICNDEKTFSRSDALVRHRRVKHGIH